ncbi:MAG: thiamine diphosphokinase [Rickettsiaceae bacterium]|nr:thiamine diphosphokinase [Rickettsiaceae bacterium]
MKANLILNGNIDLPLIKTALNNATDIYAADGAFDKIVSLNLPIKAILGDLDSLKEKPNNIEIIELLDQNFTDFEKSLKYLQTHYQEIDVYGASGREQDHFCGNLHVAKKHILNSKITFFDEHQYYFLINSSATLNVPINSMISIVPFPTLENITTRGLQYPLNNENLALGNRIGTRNVATENVVTIEFQQGTAIIFVSNTLFKL